jgi:hypothetical protein
MPADDVYKVLTLLDKHADELLKLDGDFAQIAGGKLAAFQRRAWDSKWESKVAVRGSISGRGCLAYRAQQDQLAQPRISWL